MARTLPRRKAAAPDVTTYQPEADEVEDSAEEEAPRARKTTKTPEKPQSTAGKGWSSLDKQKRESGDYAENLKISEEQTLVKLLDEEPFVVYRQHWIERSGKRSFTCIGEGCPLCEQVGDKARLQAGFNVVDLTDADNPEVKVWTVGTRVAGSLKSFAADKKTSPLNRTDLYWAVSKSGKGTSTQYSITPVKERDVEDDWDLEPLSADEIKDFQQDSYDDSIVDVQTRKQLQEIADELLDD